MIERHGRMRVVASAAVFVAVCVVAVLADLSRYDPFGPGLGWSPGIVVIAGLSLLLLIRSGHER